MCVAAIAWQAHPRWPLVVIANRDEYQVRPSAPLARWDNGILAGRDLQAGGTWLGVTSRRFALVTNRRAEGYPRLGMASRGDLVTAALLGEDAGDTAAMNPFNLFECSAGHAAFLTTNDPAFEQRGLAPGIHSVSNGALDEPWFKKQAVEAALAEWLTAPAPLEALFAPLADDTRDPSQPDSHYAAVFVRNEVYGTRCSTVVAVDEAGRGVIIERSYDSLARTSGEVRLDFAWRP